MKKINGWATMPPHVDYMGFSFLKMDRIVHE